MSKLEFQEDCEPICLTDGFWYSLTDGGYLKPKDFLTEESCKKVEEAIAVIRDFERGLEDNELLEEY